MPVEVVPNRIELSDLMGGFAPDGEEASLPINLSPDLLNLLADRSTGALELRKGFTRLTAGRLDLAGFHIKHVHYYEAIDTTHKKYLIAILTNGTDNAADNIRIYAYNLLTDTFSRIDTAGRAWAVGGAEHWYAVIENTYYGGTRGEEIYSWHPTDGWNADPTLPDVRTFVTDTGNDVDTAEEYAKDFAFKKGTKVAFQSKFYSTLKGIRYETWESGERYRHGERVSRRVDHGTVTYWRSFACIDSHTSDATNRPGDGTGDWEDKWKNLRLERIKDEDGDITADWAFMPLPGKGSVGAYHGFRLFVTHPDSDNRGRVQYSALAEPEKDADIADLDFRPTDWAPNNQGTGGGWFTVPFAKGDAIQGMFSYGTYLFIMGRWQSFVVAGANPDTWTVRELGKAGILSQSGICEHDGLVFFLSPKGVLFVTDGTSVQEAPGFEKVREYVKNRIDTMLEDSATANWLPTIESYGGYVWMALPDSAGADRTMLYEPSTQSFWLTDIPALGMTVGEKGRAQRLWFSNATLGADTARPVVYQYTDDAGSEVYTDDDHDGSASSAETNDITWRWRSPWMSFGSSRNERRIRRAWALVTGETGDTATVSVFRNYEEGSARTSVDRTLVGSAQAEFLEAKVADTTGYSVGISVSGAANAQTAVHGVGLDTEPVRTRFKRG